MQLNKKLITLLAFFSLLVCVITLQDTYAKYISNASGTSTLSIARWKILVNNLDVRENLTTNALITPTFSGNSYINPNVVAPTSTGYFDLIIAGDQTDVSFDYAITISKKSGSPVDDLKLVSYTLNNGTLVNTDTGSITGTINLDDSVRTHTIRVNIEWIDDENQTMNNTLDTAATNNDYTELNVSVNFIQKTAVVASN